MQKGNFKIKIIVILKRFILPILGFFILSALAILLNNVYGFYLAIVLIYGSVLYFFFLAILLPLKTDRTNLYGWLDSLGGGQTFLTDLFAKVHTEKEIINNLNKVYNLLMVYSEHNLRKLKLLRAYFKTINNENAADMFSKTVITGIVSFILWTFQKGNLVGKINMNFTDLNINIKVIEVFNIVLYLGIFLIWLAFMIIDYFQNKKINKIVLEILEVCIEEVKGTK